VEARVVYEISKKVTAESLRMNVTLKIKIDRISVTRKWE